jgi:hypothetical protein
MKIRNRHQAHLVHIQDSKSGGWFILRDDAGEKYFAHRKSLLDPGSQPAIGWNVSFTILPPLLGQPLKRATEVQVLPSSRGGDIAVGHSGGITRMILKSAGSERVLGEMKFVAEMELK